MGEVLRLKGTSIYSRIYILAVNDFNKLTTLCIEKCQLLEVPLIERVDKWRKLRNECVHGFVKFPHTKAKVALTREFLEKVKKAAADGKQLSDEVSEWRKRQTTLKRNLSKSSL